MPQPSSFIQDLLFNGVLTTPLIKPDISFGNYFLEWHEKSPGLYPNEILKFKTFVKHMIPYLEPMMKMIDIPRPNKDPFRKVITDKGKLSISDKYNGHITFILNMDASGSTVLFREEQVLISDESFEKLQVHYDSKDLVLFDKLKDLNNDVSVKWIIGNLLFDRMEHNK
ncbi:MAG: hypothetical protein WKF36_00620 [Candidatus Nitrosocosmicus sp.]